MRQNQPSRIHGNNEIYFGHGGFKASDLAGRVRTREEGVGGLKMAPADSATVTRIDSGTRSPWNGVIPFKWFLKSWVFRLSCG